MRSLLSCLVCSLPLSAALVLEPGQTAWQEFRQTNHPSPEQLRLQVLTTAPGIGGFLEASLPWHSIYAGSAVIETAWRDDGNSGLGVQPAGAASFTLLPWTFGSVFRIDLTNRGNSPLAVYELVASAEGRTFDGWMSAGAIPTRPLMIVPPEAVVASARIIENPEPATFALAGFGLVLLTGLRRRYGSGVLRSCRLHPRTIRSGSAPSARESTAP